MDLARVGVHGGVRAARLCGQGSQRLKGWRGVRARRLGAGRDSAMRGAVAAGAARIWRRVGARVVLLPFWCGARYGCGEAWVALSARLRARGDSEELIQGSGSCHFSPSFIQWAVFQPMRSDVDWKRSTRFCDLIRHLPASLYIFSYSYKAQRPYC